MSRNPPDDLAVSVFAHLSSKSRRKSWCLGYPVTLRSKSRSLNLTNIHGTIVGHDRHRLRWILVNFEDGSINWCHVDMLSPRLQEPSPQSES